MPALFWIDLAASCTASVISASLFLTALAAGPRQPVNGSFAIFMLVQSLWGILSVAMRITLWLGTGNPQVFAEWNALLLFIMGFCILAFSTYYVECPSRPTQWAIAAGFVVALISLPLLFEGRIVSNVRLHPNGTTLLDVSRLAVCFSILPIFFYGWSFILFWRERKRKGETTMAYSILVLLAGFIVGGMVEVHFPVQSFTHSISIGIMGYGVLARQLFNPLNRVTENLKKEILERHRIEKALTQSLREKDMLLREIHHRVKNNMQIVTSLLKLQSERIKNKNTLAFFTDCRHRVESMAMIHEMLYQTPNFSDVPFGEYVRKLVSSLERSYGMGSRRVRFSLRSEVLHLDINKAIPCGLIINEIISNALKHAFSAPFKGDPAITISMRTDRGNRMHLVIRDNGLGLSPTALSGSRGSLGMRLIRILVQDQLDGTVRVDSQKGTAYSITFPIG
jgi:two-component sensor histidine kinase